MPFVLEPGDDPEAIAEDDSLSEEEKITALVEHFNFTEQRARNYLEDYPFSVLP